MDSLDRVATYARVRGWHVRTHEVLVPAPNWGFPLYGHADTLPDGTPRAEVAWSKAIPQPNWKKALVLAHELGHCEQSGVEHPDLFMSYKFLPYHRYWIEHDAWQRALYIWGKLALPLSRRELRFAEQALGRYLTDYTKDVILARDKTLAEVKLEWQN